MDTADLIDGLEDLPRHAAVAARDADGTMHDVFGIDHDGYVLAVLVTDAGGIYPEERLSAHGLAEAIRSTSVSEDEPVIVRAYEPRDVYNTDVAGYTVYAATGVTDGGSATILLDCAG